MIYNPWPIGKVPKELRRPEIEQISDKYELRDARDAVTIFENKVAEFVGCEYAVAVDCCTHAIELCLEYLLRTDELNIFDVITIPNRTYVSIPMTIQNMGFSVKYESLEWSGAYRLKPTNVIDAAVRWTRKMYIPGTLMCLSFQIKKAIPIGRGGMVLTDNKEAYEMIKLMSYDGRDLNTAYDSPEHIKCRGFHYYMTPEDAARGIILMDAIGERGDYMNFTDYPRVDKMMNI